MLVGSLVDEYFDQDLASLTLQVCRELLDKVQGKRWHGQVSVDGTYVVRPQS